MVPSPHQVVEFRASQRYRILQRCLIRPPGVGASDGWRGIVFSLSKNGIGVTLPLAVERGTELVVEPWNLPEVAPLRARVIHITRLEFVWLAGCELAQRLTPDEMAAWLTTVTAGT